MQNWTLARRVFSSLRTIFLERFFSPSCDWMRPIGRTAIGEWQLSKNDAHLRICRSIFQKFIRPFRHTRSRTIITVKHRLNSFISVFRVSAFSTLTNVVKMHCDYGITRLLTRGFRIDQHEIVTPHYNNDLWIWNCTWFNAFASARSFAGCYTACESIIKFFVSERSLPLYIGF